MVTYTALKENWKKILERDKGLEYPWGWWKNLSGTWCNYFCQFLNLTQRLKYSLKKEGAVEESNVDFEIGVNAPAPK